MMIKQIYNKVIRPYLPRRPILVNGVAVNRARLLDLTWSLQDVKNEPVTALKATVKTGDIVCIIGAGDMVTGVTAARQVGNNGHVHVYDPQPGAEEYVKENLELNQVADRVTLHPKAVHSSDDIVDCDVLEIDCEGCEVELLNDFDMEPRVLIVEHHTYLKP